jgi:hypothetical protein
MCMFFSSVATLYSNVCQTVVRGGPHTVLEELLLQKIVSDTWMKNTPIHVYAKLPLLVDQQKVSELVISITFFIQSLF